MLRLLRPLALLGALAALSAAAWFAAPRQAEAILLSDARAAPLADRPGDAVIFLRIENAGGPDRLLDVSSPAGMAWIVNPEAPEGAALPAATTVDLAPDGAHLRLSGIEGEIADGRLFPLTLHFEKAGALTTRARVAPPLTEGTAAEHGLPGFGDICRAEPGEPHPRLELSAVPGPEGWRLSLALEEFAFREDLMDGPHVPGTGHGHLYVDGLKLGRLLAPEASIGALPPGPVTLRVTLNTNDHRTYVVDDAPATATVTVSTP